MARKIMKGGTNITYNTPLYIIITILLSYIAFLLYSTSPQSSGCSNAPPIHIEQSVSNGAYSNSDRFNDPYSPPIRNDFMSYFPGFGGYRGFGRGIPELDIRGSIPIPINVPTRGYPTDYTQIGILTKIDETSNEHPLILPLMGRKSTSSRDRMQYYTMSNTGSVNTKLPIKRNGKSCTSELGCPELYSGDEIYVEGYKTKFVPTIYENNTFNYVI